MNTTLLYSVVRIAPSATITWSETSSQANSGLSDNGDLRSFCHDAPGRCTQRVVPGLGMVDDHGGGGLLGKKLESFRQLHAKRFRGKQLEHDRVIVEIGTRAISPRVPLTGGNSQLALDPPVCPFGDGFGCFDGEAMRVERF